MPLRVAWFGHASGHRGDGLSSYSARTVAALLQRGMEVRFFAHRRDGDAMPASSAVGLSSLRFKTVTLPLPGTKRRILAELRDFSPDVVHLSLSFSLLDAWIVHQAQRLGAATFATVHLPYSAPRTMRGRVLRGLYRFHAHTLRSCDRCIVLSEEQKQLLVSLGCSPKRIEVMPNGVDTDTFTPGPSHFRDQLGARFVVAYMGRLDPEKRVGALMRAFMQLHLPADHMLVIAGRGVQEQRLRSLSRNHGNIRMLGVVSDVARVLDILRGADVFVLPSTAEALSLSLLEAMAAGCAVVATDVAEDGAALGDAGIRVPVRPIVPHLINALRILVADPSLRTSLGTRARERAERLFSLHTRMDRLVELYQEVVEAPPAAA